jgi:hypothetical protein
VSQKKKFSPPFSIMNFTVYYRKLSELKHFRSYISYVCGFFLNRYIYFFLSHFKENMMKMELNKTCTGTTTTQPILDLDTVIANNFPILLSLYDC